MIAVMIGLWGSANPFGNLVGAIISDRFGRVKVLGKALHLNFLKPLNNCT
jgi:hypothetical protein